MKPVRRMQTRGEIWLSWRNACLCIRICTFYVLCFFNFLFFQCTVYQDAAALQSFYYEGKINVVFQVAKDFTS